MRKRIGNLDFDTANHCVYHLTTNVVFCTTFRKHTLTAERRDFLCEILTQLASERNSEITEINSEIDQILIPVALLKYYHPERHDRNAEKLVRR
jgi:REP element-mobilizing transposase RayT